MFIHPFVSTRVALASSAGGARGAAVFLEQAGERRIREALRRTRATREIVLICLKRRGSLDWRADWFIKNLLRGWSK
jgi:hypothetical protein